MWKYFQVQAGRPVIGCPKLPAWTPPPLGLQEGPSHQPSGRAICCPYPLPRPSPHSTHLIYFPVKQFVNTFTDETDYDRIKALPASFYKLNYETQIEFLKKKKKNLLLSHCRRKMNHMCCEVGHGLLMLPRCRVNLHDRNQEMGVSTSAGSLKQPHGAQNSWWRHDWCCSWDSDRPSQPFISWAGYGSLEKLQCLSCLGHGVGFKS